MKDFLQAVDNSWPQSEQYFVLGLECGFAVGLLVVVFLIFTQKIKFN